MARELATFRGYAQRIRDLKHRGEEADLEILRLVSSLYLRKELWPDQYKGDFDRLLRQEGFCTPALWHKNQKATEAKIPIRRYGVHAANVLASLPEKQRASIMKQTDSWITEHHRFPVTYQRINWYVNHATGALRQKGKQSDLSRLRAENKRLRAENEKLKIENKMLKARLRKAA